MVDTIKYIGSPAPIYNVRSFGIEFLGPDAPGESRIAFTMTTSGEPPPGRRRGSRAPDLQTCRISMEPEGGSTGVLTIREIHNGKPEEDMYSLSDENAMAAFFFSINTTGRWTLGHYLDALRGLDRFGHIDDEFGTDLTRFEFINRRNTSLDFMYANHTYS